MSLKADDFPMKYDGSDAFLHGILITFDGKDEWSLYDDPPAKPPTAVRPNSKKPKSPKAKRKKDRS